MDSPAITAPSPNESLFGERFAPAFGRARTRSLSAAPAWVKAMAAGLLMTLLQATVAIGLLAPVGDFGDRYASLLQHDSYWFINIVDYGYRTPVPPIEHKVMEVSNVAFFPAYPLLAGALHRLFDLDSGIALLIVAQMAAWGFWSYFFLFCQRWKLSLHLRLLGALAILAHPAAFFLVAGYSESLFMMSLFGFLYWSGGEGRAARVLAAIHGIVLSATRIVGIPCAAFPLIQSAFADGWSTLRHPLNWVRRNRGRIGLTIVASLGAFLFFLYCQLRWGHWDMYMLTQYAGWAIEPDYLAIFDPSNYNWIIPSWNNPTEMSQCAMLWGLLLFLAVLVCELVMALRGQRDWRLRVGFYACAGFIYYLSVSGVACVNLESMLRYEFPVHSLIVLAFVHFLRQYRNPPIFLRLGGTVAVLAASAAGLCVEAWCIWNFTRGNWIA